MKKSLKNLMSILVIVLGGFVLFNLAFILAALFINGAMRIVGTTNSPLPHFFSRVLYLVVIFLISLGVFKSKANTLVKATYLTMPLMIILVFLGMVLYGQPILLIIAICGLIISMVLLYLYKKNLSWHYYFATLYVAILGLCIMIFNIQI